MQARTESQKRLSELNVALQEAKIDAQKQVARYESAKARNDEIVKSLGMVVNEKQLASLSSNSSEEIKSHIRILQESIKRLESASGNE